jgi:uncharacterized protein DUF4397
MFRMVRTLPFTLALAALSIFTASCGSSSGTKFRLVYAIPDGQQQADVAIDGTVVATAVPYGTATPGTGYRSVASGTRKLEVRPTGQTTAQDYVNSNVPFNGGNAYTVVATGYASNNLVVSPLFTDNATAPTSGNASLRIIQASPEGLGSNQPVDIYIVAPGGGFPGTSPDIPSVAYQAASAYKTFPAGTYDLLLTPAGTPSVNITIPNASFSSGKIYTYVLIDVAPPGGAMSAFPVQLTDN